MNKIISVMLTGILTGITCTIGMKIGQTILDKVEVYKTKDSKIIKIKS